jgi:acyl-CoA dehydrogenase-like protein
MEIIMEWTGVDIDAVLLKKIAAAGHLFTAAGASAIYQRNMLERRFRDINTISQHALAHNRTFETAGKALLGLPIDEPMFC